MELDFDKEINALLRQTVKQDLLFSESDLQTEHLDADEISAFAENALPDNAKRQYTEHLADCDGCRKSLSELIRRDSKAEVVMVANEDFESAPIELPWFRKLFVFPGLAYAMGGLVIAFTGLTALVLLQNFNSGGFEMAKSETSSQQAKPTAQLPADNLLNSNAFNAAANSSSDSVPELNTNTATAATPELEESDSIYRRNQNGPYAERDLPSVSKEGGRARNEGAVGAVQPILQPGIVSGSKLADKTVSDDRMADSEPTLSAAEVAKPAPKSVARKTDGLSKKESVLTIRGGEVDVDEKQNKLKSPAESRQINGKSFNRRDGVWYDSAYQNQRIKNVRRGTSEYKNLDTGLRAVADKFTETIVVVWKQTAYRIQ